MATLKELVKTELRRQGLSRLEVAQRLGYRNITKGLRRLDTFVDTLEAPESFPNKLKDALGITDEAFEAAARETGEYLVNREREQFRPYVYVISDRRITPAIIAPMLLNISIPIGLGEKPEKEQLAIVRRLYEKHRFHGAGFIYYRSYDESYKFNEKGDLIEHITNHVEPLFAYIGIGGKTLANQSSNLLTFPTTDSRD